MKAVATLLSLCLCQQIFRCSVFPQSKHKMSIKLDLSHQRCCTSLDQSGPDKHSLSIDKNAIFYLGFRYLWWPEDKSPTFIDPLTSQLKIYNIKTSMMYGFYFFGVQGPNSGGKVSPFHPVAIWNNRVLMMTFA